MDAELEALYRDLDSTPLVELTGDVDAEALLARLDLRGWRRRRADAAARIRCWWSNRARINVTQ